MSSNVVSHATLKSYLGQINPDLGDVQLSAIAGAIVSRIDEPPQLSSERKGENSLFARLGGTPFLFSRREYSVAVHIVVPYDRMLRGLLSKTSSLSEIAKLLEPASDIAATR